MGVIAKQSIKGTIVTYIGVAIGFFTTFFVLTRFLTAQEIGLARVLVDAATLFIGLAQLGTSSSIIRFYPYFKDNKQDNGFFFWSALVPLIGFIIVSLFFVALNGPINTWFAEKSPLFVNYYYFVLPLSFFMLYQTVAETDANVKMRIVFPRAVREIGVRLLLLIVYLLYAFNWLTLDGFVIALCGIYAIAALCNWVYLIAVCHTSLKPDFKFPNKEIVSKYLQYTLFLVLTALSTVLAPSLSSFFITAQLGLDYTGIFAIATYMAVVVSIPYRSLNAIAAPQLADAIKQKDVNQVQTLSRQVAANLFLIGAIILLAIWINIDLIFKILPNGEQFATAKYVVLILGLSQLMLATFNVSLSVLNYSKYYYYSLLYSFVLTILAIVLNNIFIPIWGMNGAAMANLLSNLVYFVLIVLTVYLKTRTSVFSISMLKTCVVMLIAFALNAMCDMLPELNIFVMAVLKSLLIGGGAVFAAYKWHISPDINVVVNKFLTKN